MLDLKCYDRMHEDILKSELVLANDARYDLRRQMLLHDFANAYVYEHKFGKKYMDGFVKDAKDKHLITDLMFKRTTEFYEDLFEAFEEYVEEQLEAEKE